MCVCINTLYIKAVLMNNQFMNKGLKCMNSPKVSILNSCVYADNMVIKSCSSHSLGGLKQKQGFSNTKTT